MPTIAGYEFPHNQFTASTDWLVALDAAVVSIHGTLESLAAEVARIKVEMERVGGTPPASV